MAHIKNLRSKSLKPAPAVGGMFRFAGIEFPKVGTSCSEKIKIFEQVVLLRYTICSVLSLER